MSKKPPFKKNFLSHLIKADKKQSEYASDEEKTNAFTSYRNKVSDTDSEEEFEEELVAILDEKDNDNETNQEGVDELEEELANSSISPRNRSESTIFTSSTGKRGSSTFSTDRPSTGSSIRTDIETPSSLTFALGSVGDYPKETVSNQSNGDEHVSKRAKNEETEEPSGTIESGNSSTLENTNGKRKR